MVLDWLVLIAPSLQLRSSRVAYRGWRPGTKVEEYRREMAHSLRHRSKPGLRDVFVARPQQGGVTAAKVRSSSCRLDETTRYRRSGPSSQPKLEIFKKSR